MSRDRAWALAKSQTRYTLTDKLWMRQEPAYASGLGLLAIRSSVRSVIRRKSHSAGMLGRCTSIVSCWALFQAVWLFAPLDIGTIPWPNFTTATEIDGQLSLVQPQRPSQSVCSTTDSAYLIALF